MKRLVLPLLSGVVAVLLLAAAGLPSGAESFERGRAELRTGKRVILLDVELAQTDEQRSRVLMRRTALARNAGMLFLFEEQSRGGFWMKNTRIPLSIAFMDGRGVILRILDMVPCRRDPCPVYDPGVVYRSALEVNRGAFRRWGATRGDRVKLRR
ncbi:hypothetical protein BH18ACT13_BH18ACT13_20520 [soil metagenome]